VQTTARQNTSGCFFFFFSSRERPDEASCVVAWWVMLVFEFSKRAQCVGGKRRTDGKNGVGWCVWVQKVGASMLRA